MAIEALGVDSGARIVQELLRYAYEYKALAHEEKSMAATVGERFFVDTNGEFVADRHTRDFVTPMYTQQEDALSKMGVLAHTHMRAHTHRAFFFLRRGWNGGIEEREV